MNQETTALMKPATNLRHAMRQLDDRGFCVLNKLLSDTQLAEMRLRITQQAQYETEIGAAGMDDAQLSSQNQYIYAILNKGRVFLDLFENDLIHKLIEHLLGEDYLLSASDAVIAAPGVPTCHFTPTNGGCRRFPIPTQPERAPVRLSASGCRHPWMRARRTET